MVGGGVVVVVVAMAVAVAVAGVAAAAPVKAVATTVNERARENTNPFAIPMEKLIQITARSRSPNAGQESSADA